MKQAISSKYAYAIIILMAILFVTFLSSTSPFYSHWHPVESTIYQIIGKGWTEGKIPYVDLWDQKGPYLYFINAAGYWFTGNKVGLYLIEILHYLFVFFLLYVLFRRKCSVKISLFLLLITAAHMSQLLEGGNNIELYVLPLLIYAFTRIWDWAEKYAEKGVVDHPVVWSFSYGLILSISMLTRLTNAVGICIAVAIIFVILCFKRRWHAIILNGISFLAGFLVLALPFWIYFYVHDGLYEMIFASILYNIEYLGNTQPTLLTPFLTPYVLISQILAYIGTYGLFLVSSILCFIDKQKIKFHLIWSIIGGLTMFYFLNTFMYGHYAYIAVPYFAILMLEFKRMVSVYRDNNKIVSSSLITLGVFFCTLLVLNGGYQMFQSVNVDYNVENELEGGGDIINHIPEAERDDLVVWQGSSSIYLHNMITPPCRFFVLQEWYPKFSRKIRPMIYHAFEEKKPKYILISSQSKDVFIYNFVRSNYCQMYCNEIGKLYVRKN